MELQQIDHEIKKIIRSAYNVESTKMKKADTLSVTISIHKDIKEHGDLITDLCYNEAFMHGLVMVEEPIVVFNEETEFTNIGLVMVKMQDIPFYIRNHG